MNMGEPGEPGELGELGELGLPGSMHGADHHTPARAGRAPAASGCGPLESVESPGDAPFDVFLSGAVFLDIIFTGLRTPPSSGTEVWTEGMGSSPGGVANLAVALSRLGAQTALAAAFGTDVYGDFCWETLESQEGVDLSASRRFSGWHSPVTVSLAYLRDRSMVSHGHMPPVAPDEMIGVPLPARACFAALGPEPEGWVEKAQSQGALLFADVGWDPSEQWDPEILRRLESCHAFMPNDAEAMRYTRTDSPEAALSRLAEIVPVAVVTCGSRGALAVDNETGERAEADGLPAEALDPTGAGDVFAAGFITGALAGWPLIERLRFANLTAALSVQQFGGSLSAPCWGDVAAWWQGVKASNRAGASSLVAGYGFLDDLMPEPVARTVRRATATVGFRTQA